MRILSDDQREVLAFVVACNRSSYNPTAEEVTLWQSNKSPTKAEYRTVRRTLESPIGSLGPSTAYSRMMSTMLGDTHRSIGDALQRLGLGGSGTSAIRDMIMTKRELVKPGETPIEHLVRIRWLEEVQTPGKDAGLRLSDLGRALLRDEETEDTIEGDVSVVVLGRADPLAYPTLVGQLAAAGPGLLVDPYLKLEDVHMVVVSTQLTRLLVSGKPQNKGPVSAMQAYLESPSLGRHVEVRASNTLHDRVLISDDGDVLTLGTSLNGVGHTTTVLTPIPSPARESLKDEYERLWLEASPVGPPSTDGAKEPKDMDGTEDEQETPPADF
ncbi:hypothetical protein ABQE96_12035 [Mycobacteroides chelonae]|uniref:hypothetical protein n=1 Tax=Mycobacteroides chelonae TaxID=1774 RepID=UPI0032047531